ncbi:PREDICTED: nucleolar protein of 40 kDa-like [Branchiostoma belcheri]|uniref:Zinc finger CCHC domain-containing protein 17 n=1 Tax=Branchiostoma belcheri TaxID=7741 RepID=A0A6P4ZFR2_BRABE|nr:PREDICTED: nucleolar protein of 40 kDa-like [Branchiostoma belcheri]
MSSRDYHRDRGDRQGEDNLPAMHTIFQGEVVSLQPYGCFIKIPGCKKNGLVHKSQMSASRVEDPKEVVDMGDRVYCKVISLGEGGNGKISLSMKVVNQGDGHDLDPNNVAISMEEQRKRNPKSYERQKITLGAVLNTTCRKCGGKGHMAQDCFSGADGKKYELLPEEDETTSTQQSAPQTSQESKKRKKKKKEKKHKKSKKKHKRHSDDSSSEDSSSDEEDRHRKRHKHKHKKEHKKARASDSDSDSDSDDRSHKRHKKHKR